ncbi:hypothetical protein QMK19_04125 [Streptomyces sp. H10-C2]|uniref:hypothetical protein n=1 Tax=unclassified Streptomyces TaxID=2593676 RepID=UPI0024BA65A1|nr:MULTISPECIES: hypothetical protein [unclassified Streptomyces]MDJ0343534.1 hypothetical protein [Streptomyces sp. PH10-H1]MDJ0368890.1 hypothetical protein [Streptomyces sp. H10-C2]
MTLRIPRFGPLPRPAGERRWSVLADRPFAAFCALNGLMGLQYQALLLPLPLWIVSSTDVPRWTIVGIMLINTVMCVLFQVGVGGKFETSRQGGVAMRRAGLIFLAGCTALALVPGLPGWAAVFVVCAAVGVHTIGELWHAPATFALGFGLAPAHAQGQYQGLLSLGLDGGQALAPALLISLCIGLGQAGWVLLGVFFAVIGLASPAVTRWAERTRPAVVPQSPAPSP